MRRRITLGPLEEYAFNIGRTSLILILRESTQNVILTGDSLTDVELSRSDIVDVTRYREKRVFLRNDNDTAITVEFQLSDMQISIREQKMAVNGGIVVDEITSPITVADVLAPVSIAGIVPVNIGDVSVAVNNFPAVQRVVIEGSVSNDADNLMSSIVELSRSDVNIQGRTDRKFVLLKSTVDFRIGSNNSVLTEGLLINAGELFKLETSGSFLVASESVGKLSVVEVFSR